MESLILHKKNSLFIPFHRG